MWHVFLEHQLELTDWSFTFYHHIKSNMLTSVSLVSQDLYLKNSNSLLMPKCDISSLTSLPAGMSKNSQENCLPKF